MMAQQNDEELLLTDRELKFLYDQLPLTNHPATLAIYSIPFGAVLGWSQIVNQNGLAKARPLIEKQERERIGEYLSHCHLSSYETHRLISIHDIERLQNGQALKGE